MSLTFFFSNLIMWNANAFIYLSFTCSHFQQTLTTIQQLPLHSLRLLRRNFYDLSQPIGFTGVLSDLRFLDAQVRFKISSRLPNYQFSTLEVLCCSTVI